MQEHIFYTFDPFDDYPWEKSVTEAYEDGIRIFSFLYPLMLAWQEDGSFDFTLPDELTDRIISLIPAGKMMPRAFLTTPFWWDEKYPEELLKFSGPMPKESEFSHTGEPLWQYEAKQFHGLSNASKASEQWRNDAGNAVAAAAGHLVERYGREHIYAIQLAYGTCGEWGEFGSYLFGQIGNGDYSEPMVRRYRQYLREKYGDKPEFAAVMPPDKMQRQIVECGMLRSGKTISGVIDYHHVAATVKCEALAHFCRRIKEVVPDMLCGSFGGNVMSYGASANSLNYTPPEIEYLLKVKELDFLSTPNNYFDFRKGATFSHTPVKTAALHKRFIAECDTRSEIANNVWAPDKGFSESQFLRETAFNLLTSGYLWHYDFGKNWYALPEIRKMRRKFLSLDPELFDYRRQAEIAVVVDPGSIDHAAGQAGFYRQFGETLTRELSRCGAFADHITVADMENLPPYKLYIFRDVFLYRPEIRDFLIKHQASALWIGPAGAVGQDGIDFSLSEKLTSFKIRPVTNAISANSVTLYDGNHFLNRGMVLPATPGGVEDLNAVWQPLLYAEVDEDCEVAGLNESLDLPGMVSRKSGSRYDVWSASALLFAGTIRNLASASGVKLRVLEGEAEIYGAGKTFAIRITGDMPVTLRAEKPLTDLMSDETFIPVNDKVIFHGRKGESYLFCEKEQ